MKGLLVLVGMTLTMASMTTGYFIGISTAITTEYAKKGRKNSYRSYRD